MKDKNVTTPCFDSKKPQLQLPQNTDTLICEYDFPGRHDNTTLEMMYYAVYDKVLGEEHTNFHEFRLMHGVGRGAIATLTSLRRMDPAQQKILAVPLVHVFYSSWHWCSQTFRNVTATSRDLIGGEMSSERLEDSYINSESRTYIPDWADNDASSTNLTTNPRTYYSLKQPSTGRRFNISAYTYERIHRALFPALNTAIYVEDGVLSAPTLSYDFSRLFYYGNGSTITSAIATTLSNQIRNFNKADNVNAAKVTGEARSQEIFVQVRWPWIITPLLEALLSHILLVVCILLTRRENLIRTSLIAPLLYGVELNDSEHRKLLDLGAVEKIEEESKGVLVTFRQNDQGHPSFIQV